jgi:hypothetical protein
MVVFSCLGFSRTSLSSRINPRLIKDFYSTILRQKNKNPDVIGDLFVLEQVTGIGPAYLPWQGNVLPLNYTCMALLAR